MLPGFFVEQGRGWRHGTRLRREGSEGSACLWQAGSKGSKGVVAALPQIIKVSLRDLLSVSYGMISILVISRCAAPPYPAAPDFPLFRGQNKTPRNTLFISGSTVSTGYSATVEVLHRTSKWGEVRRLACPLRRFPFAAPPNCGGGKGTGFAGSRRRLRIQ